MIAAVQNILQTIQAQRACRRETIHNDAELAAYIKERFGVTLPSIAVCPGHVAPFTAFADAYFARAPVTVWKASRGFGGKSFMLALLGLVEATTLGCDVNILGGSGDQSANVIRYLNHWPCDLIDNDAQTIRRFKAGNEIRALLASSKSVRGGHPARLRLDEVDEIALPILDAVMGQPMSQGGVAKQTVMSSTHQYADGTMTEVLNRAALRGWPIAEWCVDGNCDIMGIDKDIKMKDVRKGDRVYAYKDGKLIRTEVADAWQSGTKPTVIVETNEGVITCTADHRILTPDGWKYAGELVRGDAVMHAMRKDASFFKWSMQKMQGRSALPRLRKTNRQKIGAVLDLRLKIEGQFCYNPQGSKVNLPKMREEKTGYIEDVYGVLPQRNERAERETGWRYGTCPTENSAIREQPKTNEQRGTCRRGIVRQIGDCLSSGATDRSLRRRFHFTDLQPSDRSQWKILAQQSTTARTRQEQKASSGIVREKVACALDRRNALVDIATVRSVGQGPTIPVFDLTVADGASFVANGIVVHNCWRETQEPHGWLSQVEIASKRNEVTEAMWLAEYDLQDPSPESRAINSESVARMFRRELGIFEGAQHEYIEIETPQPRAVYVTGADWARKQDWTIIYTLRLDCNPARLVAFERMGREPWPVMIERFDRRVMRFPGAAAHDATGIGDVVGGYMRSEAMGIIMAGRARSDMLSGYIASIERGEIVSPFIRWMEKEHHLASVDDVYGSGHLPDTISAGALAWSLATMPVEQSRVIYAPVKIGPDW